MIDAGLLSELNKIQEPGPLLAELARRFPGRTGQGISGQLSDSALVDMGVKAKAAIRVYTADTYRLFPETYQLFDAIERKYQIKIERLGPPEAELKKMIAEKGEYLFFDTKELQEYCCYVRKVLPNERALDSLDVWITGLRADQSTARADMKRMEIIEHGPSKRPILKVSPLTHWNEKQVRAYLVENHVPVHPLLEAKLPGGYYYESLGCVICTTPIGPYEPRRAGRWRWFNSQDDKKECGLHLPHPTDAAGPPNG